LELFRHWAVASANLKRRRQCMTFGRGLLLWLIGIPLPIILLLALFWR
jgi:hypothetical protein